MNRFRSLGVAVVAMSLAPLGLAQHVVSQESLATQGNLETPVSASCRDSVGNFLAVGSIASTNFGFVEKLSPKGIELWQCLIPYQPAGQVLCDNGGNVYVIGSSNVYISAFSPSGQIKWSASDSSFSAPVSVSLDGSGDVTVACQNAATTVLQVAKHSSSSGAVLWTQQFQYQNGFHLADDGKGNLYGLSAPRNGPATLLKLNESTGATLWSKTDSSQGVLPSGSWEAITTFSNGDLLASGENWSGNGSTYIGTLDRIDPSGSYVYRKHVGPGAANTTFKFDSNAFNPNPPWWIRATVSIGPVCLPRTAPPRNSLGSRTIRATTSGTGRATAASQQRPLPAAECSLPPT